MPSEAKYQAPKTPGAPTNRANAGPTLTPEELAEFMASLEEDEALAARAARADSDAEYND